MTPEQRAYINGTLKHSGKGLLFVGGCDYVGAGELSLEQLSAMAEMEIGILEQDETTVNAMGGTYGYDAAKTPTFYVCGNETEKMGMFAESGKCALAKKQLPGCTIYYSALGNLSDQVLREIARDAGVHVYAEDGVATYVNSGVVGVYNTKDAFTTVTLPVDGTYTELFSGKTYTTQDKKITLPTGESPAQMLIIE